MKQKVFLVAMLCSLFMGVQAQNPIATLEHAGATSVFYGITAFNDAYNASVNGDEVYLSAGYFYAPAAIAKGIKVYGSGHFPDSANVAKRTTISAGLTINKGADSLRLEGLYIDGDINYDGSNSVDYVKVLRSRVGNIEFRTNSAGAAKDYCSYEECYIDGDLNFSYYGTSLLLSKNIFFKQFYYISNGALIEKNILLCASDVFNSVSGSLIRDNIIFSTNPYSKTIYGNNSTGNSFNNNLLVMANPSWNKNTQINNYSGITQANIFVNQAGNAIDYSHDYHLKNPATYIGTDGTQVGLYGGLIPFKDGGIPSNPQITSKSVDTKTDANGNLKINFTVKAQDN